MMRHLRCLALLTLMSGTAGADSPGVAWSEDGHVVAWKTRAARMDQEGTLHPEPGAMTPCGRAGDSKPGLCQNP